jgi:PAS domain S-box-containing protein
MLSVNSWAPHHITERHQRSVEIDSIILRASSELAACKGEEIDRTIHQALTVIGEINHAAQTGWFLLARSGELSDVFHSTYHSLSSSAFFEGSLRQLPWCLAELNDGNAVVIHSLADLPSTAEIDRQFLSARQIHSLLMLPLNIASGDKTVLILSSTSTETNWSDGILEQCALLENIFSMAYQRTFAHEEPQTPVRCFQQLFRSSTTAMGLINNKNQFISTNKALRAILGYSEDDFQKMKCEDLFNSTTRSDAPPLSLSLSKLSSENHLCETTLARKDRTLIPAKITISLIKNNSFEDFFSVVTVEDLTEQKNSEKELSKRKTEVGVLAAQLIQSQENERKRLSRELHDDIGQRLSLAASEAAMLASQHANAMPVSLDRLDTLRDELDTLCSDIHSMSHNLHSYKLQHLGLKAALKDLCRQLSQPNFRVDLHIDDFKEPTSKDVALCLYRVAQEALNNASKHARTLVVAITITKLQNMFYMTIQDSGVGFDTSHSSQGLGLVSMSERLKLVNGQFRVHSVPGCGTEIWVSVPDQYEITELTPSFQVRRESGTPIPTLQAS